MIHLPPVVPDDPAQRTQKIVVEVPIPSISNVKRGPKRKPNVFERAHRAVGEQAAIEGGNATKKTKAAHAEVERRFGPTVWIRYDVRGPLTWEGATPVVTDPTGLVFLGLVEAGQLAGIAIRRQDGTVVRLADDDALDSIAFNLCDDDLDGYRRRHLVALVRALTEG